MPTTPGRALGHLDLDHRLSRRHRQQVRDLAPGRWEVGGRGDTLELTAGEPGGPGPSIEVAVALLREVVRDVLGPCGVGVFGVVVVETPAGLVTVTATGRRVTTRHLRPAPRDRWSPSAPPVEECQIVRLDSLRLRTADRGDPWPC